jgi:glycosyltransferase involved in cell wall biosynthesis
MRGHLTGADYFEQLRRATIVVVPSEAADVCPMVACEAFAAGIPIVASAVGGLPELVGANARGLLVPPGDPDALRRAIQELLTDEALRRALGRAALEYARGCLNPEAYYSRLTAIYADVSTNRGLYGVRR